MDRLIRTPHPRSTESMLGYILRLSEANGYSTPTRFLSPYRACGRNGAAVDVSVPIIASLVGCNPTTLQKLANFSGEKGRKYDMYLLGQNIGIKYGTNLLRLGKPAFCPHCVLKEGYIDAKWDLNAMAACPTHRCEVLHSCHQCGKRLTYRRKGLLKCKCDAGLSKAPTRDVPLQVIKIMEILAAKAHGKSVLHIENDTGLPLEHIESMPLAAFCELLEILASHALNSRRGIAKIDGLLAAFRSAEILSNWPYGYQQFLREIDNKFGSGNQHSVGLASRYKEFYASMFKRRANSNHYVFLRDELVRFGSIELGTCIIASKTASALGIDKRWVSLRELCRLWGVSPPTAKRALKNINIPMKEVGSSKRMTYLINISDLDISGFETSPKIDATGAALLAGIPYSFINHLRKKGVFKVASPTFRQHIFRVDDVERFRDALLAKVPYSSEERPPEATSISLRRLLEVSKFGDANNKTEFVISYLNGLITPIGRFGETTDDILFDKRVVRDFSRQSRTSQDNRNYSHFDAGQILKCTSGAITQLVEIGHLTSVGVPGRQFLRVSKESVNEFLSQWESVKSIKEELEVKPTRVQRIADQNGILRLVVPGRHCRSEFCSFVNRTDVSRLRELVRDDIQKFGRGSEWQPAKRIYQRKTNVVSATEAV